MNGTEDHNTQQAQHAPPQQQPQQNWQPSPALASTPDPRLKSPLLAMLLSCMPGLGQVYIGYYQRGFIHILVAASLIAFLSASGHMNPLIPMASFFLAFFWLYNIVDAGRRSGPLQPGPCRDRDHRATGRLQDAGGWWLHHRRDLPDRPGRHPAVQHFVGYLPGMG